MLTLDQIQQRYQEFTKLKESDKKLIQDASNGAYFVSEYKHNRAKYLAKRNWLTVHYDGNMSIDDLTRYILYWHYQQDKGLSWILNEIHSLLLDAEQARQAYLEQCERINLRLDIVRYLKSGTKEFTG